MENDRISGVAGDPLARHGPVPGEAVPWRRGAEIHCRLRLSGASMAKRLEKRTIVIVGGGLTAGLISRQLTAHGIDVLVLERGGEHAGGAEAKLPTQRDELRWDTHQGLVQDWSVEAYSLRHSLNDESMPVRWMEAFLPGDGRGGADNPAKGPPFRWSEYDAHLRTRVRLSPRT